MKKTLFIIAIALWQITVQAQNTINYQAVVRNGSNQLVANTSIGLRLSILDGASSTVFTESQTATTNENGLVSVLIGKINSLSTIDWSGTHSLKVEIDITGGTNYTNLGTIELSSVPNAFYATTAGSVDYVNVKNAPADNTQKVLDLQAENSALEARIASLETKNGIETVTDVDGNT